jgi:hypothetical protein
MFMKKILFIMLLYIFPIQVQASGQYSLKNPSLIVGSLALIGTGLLMWAYKNCSHNAQNTETDYRAKEEMIQAETTKIKNSIEDLHECEYLLRKIRIDHLTSQSPLTHRTNLLKQIRSKFQKVFKAADYDENSAFDKMASHHNRCQDDSCSSSVLGQPVKGYPTHCSILNQDAYRSSCHAFSKDVQCCIDIVLNKREELEKTKNENGTKLQALKDETAKRRCELTQTAELYKTSSIGFGLLSIFSLGYYAWKR